MSLCPHEGEVPLLTCLPGILTASPLNQSLQRRSEVLKTSFVDESSLPVLSVGPIPPWNYEQLVTLITSLLLANAGTNDLCNLQLLHDASNGEKAARELAVRSSVPEICKVAGK